MKDIHNNDNYKNIYELFLKNNVFLSNKSTLFGLQKVEDSTNDCGNVTIRHKIKEKIIKAIK